jgi:AAA domain
MPAVRGREDEGRLLPLPGCFCLNARNVATFLAFLRHPPVDRERDLEAAINDDLGTKMVLLAGPRQVGKTTLAKHVLSRWGSRTYPSSDNRKDRAAMRAARWPAGKALVVLDELHKWRGWKRWLKGEFDKHRHRLAFLVTGSARLDVDRRGADFLQGRYHHYRLHPFSVAEALGGGPAELPAPGAELPVEGRPRASSAGRASSGGPDPDQLFEATRAPQHPVGPLAHHERITSACPGISEVPEQSQDEGRWGGEQQARYMRGRRMPWSGPQNRGLRMILVLRLTLLREKCS